MKSRLHNPAGAILHGKCIDHQARSFDHSSQALTYQRPICDDNLASNDAVTCQAMLPH